MKATFESFFRYRYLLENLIQRDFKVKYRRSALGIMWSILNPLLMMVVLSAVFSYMFKDSLQQVNYPVYLLIGQLTFNFFNDATTNSMTSVLNAASLIKKVYIPKYIFPMEKVFFSLLNTSFSLVALFIVMLFFNVKIQLSIICLPIVLALLTVFNLGVGLFLSALTIFFRDIIHLYGVLITALTYFTPIIYPVKELPQFMQSVIIINPMYWYVETMRDIALYGVFPSLNRWVACVVCAVVALAIGLWVFKKNQDKFILYI